MKTRHWIAHRHGEVVIAAASVVLIHMLLFYVATLPVVVASPAVTVDEFPMRIRWIERETAQTPIADERSDRGQRWSGDRSPQRPQPLGLSNHQPVDRAEDGPRTQVSVLDDRWHDEGRYRPMFTEPWNARPTEPEYMRTERALPALRFRDSSLAGKFNALTRRSQCDELRVMLYRRPHSADLISRSMEELGC